MLGSDYLENIISNNDTYGHDSGDEVLNLVSKKFQETIDPTKVMGRYGEKALMLLITTASSEEAEIIVQRLSEKDMQMNRFLDAESSPLKVPQQLCTLPVKKAGARYAQKPSE